MLKWVEDSQIERLGWTKYVDPFQISYMRLLTDTLSILMLKLG